MKKLVFVLSLILLINTAILSFVLYRNYQYKTDYNSLFGSDKYMIEEVGNGDIRFYVLAPKNSEEEYILSNILKKYMKNQGFEYLPDELLGNSYFFADSNGKKVTCNAENFRNYTVWYIDFSED